MALALFFVYRAMQPAPATALAKICASARDLNVFLGYAMTSLSFIASNLALALAFDVAWPIGLASRAALVVFADFWICVMSHAVRSVPRKPLAATRFMAFEGLPAACLLHWVISSALRHSFWWCAMVWALTAAHVACTWQKTTTRAVAVTPAPAHSHQPAVLADARAQAGGIQVQGRPIVEAAGGIISFLQALNALARMFGNAPPAPAKECGVCFETFQASSRDALFSCSTHHTCAVCTARWAAQCLTNNVPVRCPGVGCTRPPEDDELVERIVGVEMFAAVVRSRLQLPQCARCDLALKLKSFSRVTCSNGHVACLFCRKSIGRVLTHRCTGADARRLSRAVASRQYKPCPCCFQLIEKTEGCNRMKHVRCSTHFCWMCLREFGPGHEVPCAHEPLMRGCGWF